jgi:phosphate:Na+ symporter
MTGYDGIQVFFQVLMGLSLFLYGMSRLESGVHTLGYSTFKRWLIRSTASPAGSVSVGILITAVLQSSSMVSLLVLAFASAGVLPLLNAVGVLLGANLGTTITGWMVATIGFKLSLQTFALPLMAGGALLQLIPQKKDTLRALGTLIFGFGLLIFGLDIMKTAVEDMALTWDLSVLSGRGLWLYFIAGAGIAAMIQSSSATMMMTLAALHGGLFDLQSAAALVIGADLGTTSTTALGSIGGHTVKRQLALAHVVFNLLVDTAAFFVILPILPWAADTLGLTDPLYALVAFHSVFNVIGLAVFIPLLKPYSRWISKRFNGNDAARPTLLDLSSKVPDAALLATAAVLKQLRADATVLSLQTFELGARDIGMATTPAQELEQSEAQDLSLEQRYHLIKHIESELLAFAMDLQAEPLTPTQVKQLTRLGAEARAIVYSSKNLKDIRHNLQSMRDSPLPVVAALYQLHREYIRDFYGQYLCLAPVDANVSGATPGATKDADPDSDMEHSVDPSLLELLADNERHFQAANTRVREIAAHDQVTGSELSDMLNANREIHHAIKSLLIPA